MQKVSPALTFCGKRIEFASGLKLVGESAQHAIITVGIGDIVTYDMFVPNVMEMLG